MSITRDQVLAWAFERTPEDPKKALIELLLAYQWDQLLEYGHEELVEAVITGYEFGISTGWQDMTICGLINEVMRDIIGDPGAPNFDAETIEEIAGQYFERGEVR